MAEINRLNAILHKRMRGFILRCLNFYPQDETTGLVIGDFVRNCGCPCIDSEISTHLNYLESKGYITKRAVSDKRLGNYEVVVAQITPKGVDLLEANIPEDPGILV